MSNRFRELYRLIPNIYLDGSPVIIEAGALQLDTTSGQVLVQLKIRNLFNKPIIACKVSIRAFEINGHELEGVDYSYLDLNVFHGQTFGAKTPIFMPVSETRSFYVSVNEVVFSDNIVWKSPDGKWNPLNIKQENVNTILRDPEYVKQYKLEIGNNANCVPIVINGLFCCTCGAINLASMGKCYNCGHSYDEITSMLEGGMLSEKVSKRLEKEQNDKDALKKKEERAKNRTKTIIRDVIIAIVLSVILWFAGGEIIKFIKYNSASKMFDAANYWEAALKFKELGEYRDADEQMIISYANCVIEDLNAGKYNDVHDWLQVIVSHKDDGGETGAVVSDACLKAYDIGVNLVNKNDYENAILIFEYLDIKDSNLYLKYCYVAQETLQDLNNKNLTKIYQSIKELNNFNNADALVQNNNYLTLIDSWEGTWKVVEQTGWAGAMETGTFRVEIVNGVIWIKSEGVGTHANNSFDDNLALHNGHIYAIYDYYVEKGDFSKGDEVVVIGNTMYYHNLTCKRV